MLRTAEGKCWPFPSAGTEPEASIEAVAPLTGRTTDGQIQAALGPATVQMIQSGVFITSAAGSVG
jgi:hypothetical protein